jgi:hypothetical protein
VPKFRLLIIKDIRMGSWKVLTTQPPSKVGTARRAVRGRLGEATLPKADLRPLPKKVILAFPIVCGIMPHAAPAPQRKRDQKPPRPRGSSPLRITEPETNANPNHTMTRNCKMARLPNSIRAKLNQRTGQYPRYRWPVPSMEKDPIGLHEPKPILLWDQMLRRAVADQKSEVDDALKNPELTRRPASDNRAKSGLIGPNRSKSGH